MIRFFLLTLLLASCVSQPKVDLFSLDVPVEVGQESGLLPVVLAVSRPSAQPGYDTPRMAYATRPHQIGYFSKNQWVDTPGNMLLPILVEDLSRRFKTVVKAPSNAEMRLDTEVVMLRQEFSANSSRIHLVLRAELVRSGKTLAGREFEIFEDCQENDPYGGVIAANKAVSLLAREVADFCVSMAPH